VRTQVSCHKSTLQTLWSLKSVPGTHQTFDNGDQATNKQVQLTELCGPIHHCKKEKQSEN
jgi:hypothetical protein